MMTIAAASFGQKRKRHKILNIKKTNQV
jgi:hypothetical protein